MTTHRNIEPSEVKVPFSLPSPLKLFVNGGIAEKKRFPLGARFTSDNVRSLLDIEGKNLLAEHTLLQYDKPEPTVYERVIDGLQKVSSVTSAITVGGRYVRLNLGCVLGQSSAFLSQFVAPPTTDPTVITLSGKSGCGKTFLREKVCEMLFGYKPFICSERGRMGDTNHGERMIGFDEIDLNNQGLERLSLLKEIVSSALYPIPTSGLEGKSKLLVKDIVFNTTNCGRDLFSRVQGNAVRKLGLVVEMKKRTECVSNSRIMREIAESDDDARLDFVNRCIVNQDVHTFCEYFDSQYTFEILYSGQEKKDHRFVNFRFIFNMLAIVANRKNVDNYLHIEGVCKALEVTDSQNNGFADGLEFTGAIKSSWVKRNYTKSSSDLIKEVVPDFPNELRKQQIPGEVLDSLSQMKFQLDVSRKFVSKTYGDCVYKRLGVEVWSGSLPERNHIAMFVAGTQLCTGSTADKMFLSKLRQYIIENHSYEFLCETVAKWSVSDELSFAEVIEFQGLDFGPRLIAKERPVCGKFDAPDVVSLQFQGRSLPTKGNESHFIQNFHGEKFNFVHANHKLLELKRDCQDYQKARHYTSGTHKFGYVTDVNVSRQGSTVWICDETREGHDLSVLILPKSVSPEQIFTDKFGSVSLLGVSQSQAEFIRNENPGLDLADCIPSMTLLQDKVKVQAVMIEKLEKKLSDLSKEFALFNLYSKGSDIY